MDGDYSGDCWAHLFNRRANGIRPELGPVCSLLERLGNPERSFAAVHVAGTNGKGSVCAMIEAALRAQGMRTGLFTSPHLVDFRERFRVDGRCVSPELLRRVVDDILPQADSLPGSDGPRRATFFELSAVIAFEIFRRCGVEIGVIETGMGGRWDATNVLLPAVAVITRIGLDHCSYLGDTLAAVAAEKAGIIKPGRPVVCGAMDEEASAVMRRTAAERRCRLHFAAEEVAVTRRIGKSGRQHLQLETGLCSYGTVKLGLAGAHQAENAATALCALECLGRQLGRELEPEILRRAWSDGLRWAGRMQLVDGSPPLLLDGAHNTQAARALAVAVREIAGSCGLVTAFMQDKDAAAALRELEPCCRRAWCVPLSCERARKPRELAKMAPARMEAQAVESLAAGLERAREWARAEGGIVLVAGSLYLVGEALALLGRPPCGSETADFN